MSTLHASNEPTVVVEPTTVRQAQRELKAASAFTVALGLFFAIGSHESTDAGMRWFLDLIFLRPGDGAERLSDYAHLADAIGGGVMVGWGVMMWLVTDRLLPLAPRQVASLSAIGLTSWFVVDSTGSIASGGWVNAILNVGFAAMFALPIARLLR